MDSKKMGFWGLTSFVAGSQVGSGIFLLPISLAVFGAAGLTSWFISGSAAMILALVFAKLSAHNPKLGGPHTFIENAFGEKLGFFSAWTYWIISWLSTSLEVVAIVAYLGPLLKNPHPVVNLFLGLFIILFVTYLNLRAVRFSAGLEFVLTLLKLLPILLIPIAGVFFFNKSHFVPFNPTADGTINVVNAATLLTFWGFLGLESATASTNSFINPSKTIPRALIVGTMIVTVTYIFTSSMIMGILHPKVLAASRTPFADAAQIMFGGNWHLLFSITAAIVCLGNLNVWTLTSGQIALGSANDGHLPKFFAKKNASNTPKWGIIISSLGMVPVLFIAMNHAFISVVGFLIDICVTSFLFIYLLSVLSYLKIFWKDQVTGKVSVIYLLIGFFAMLFCLWILYSSGIKMTLYASLIVVAGLPMYFWKIKKGFARVNIVDEK